jgi:hypothetical protein
MLRGGKKRERLSSLRKMVKRRFQNGASALKVLEIITVTNWMLTMCQVQESTLKL